MSWKAIAIIYLVMFAITWTECQAVVWKKHGTNHTGWHVIACIIIGALWPILVVYCAAYILAKKSDNPDPEQKELNNK